MNLAISILTFMAAIITGPDIDNAAKVNRQFLPYQVRWIEDDSRLRIAEKSVRIGFTYCDAFKNVRKRLHFPDRDYLFASKDQASAAEYAQTCHSFVKLYNRTKSILSHGVDSFQYKDKEGFTREERFCYIKFDNGSRIMCFSSNPHAFRVFGGDVGIDEFAFHPDQQTLWETAQGRITMGYDLGCWSAHNGVDTLFYEFAREARAGIGGWSYHRITMEDAIVEGYLDMIERKTGTRFTPEEFIADCRQRSRLEEVFQQAYMCNPQGGTTQAVPYSTIELCARHYLEFERAHLEGSGVTERFGIFNEHREKERAEFIHGWMQSCFGRLISNRTGRYTLGFDVAASGQGDLACVYVDEVKGAVQTLRGLLTCRTEDWQFLHVVNRFFMDRLPSITGCGDETGLGREICWRLAKAYEGRFEGVNFGTEKHDMGFALTGAMNSAEKIWHIDEPGAQGIAKSDITADYAALRKEFQGGKWRFSSGPNNLNKASHGDIAWAGALSKRAMQMQPSGGFARIGGNDEGRDERDGTDTRGRLARAVKGLFGKRSAGGLWA